MMGVSLGLVIKNWEVVLEVFLFEGLYIEY